MPTPKTYTKIRVIIHMVLVCVFIIIWTIAVPTGWIKSVTFVSHMSMAALVYAAASAAEASFGALKTDEQDEKD